jgi:hypothetical protein
VRGYVKLQYLFEAFKKEKMPGKKRFELTDLEDFFVAKSGGVTGYEQLGGYQGLYHLLKEKEKQGEIVSIKSSPFNGKRPGLKIRWQLVLTNSAGWEDDLVFKLSRRIDLNYYLKRPHLQTVELAEKLMRLEKFLARKAEREWASREERSLELFADEKFLATSDGRKLLSRLNLSLADLKAEKYSQMFVYWNKGLQIKEVLILENHAAFIACKRVLENGYSIFSSKPDTLIFGEGNHIIDSLKFLNELTDPQQVQLKYAGDIDPEGLAIYARLREKYPEFALELHLDYYKEMLLTGNSGYPLQSKQRKDEAVLAQIVAEFEEKEEPEMVRRITELWYANLRIPQEVITFERLIKADL